jgi:hypothetical protein
MIQSHNDNEMDLDDTQGVQENPFDARVISQ